MDYIQPTIPKNNKKTLLNRKKDDTVTLDLSKRIIFPSTAGIRNFFLKEYERELPMIFKIQSYRNKFLDFFFGLASLLGEEIFYITSLPSSSWFFSRLLATELTTVLAFSIGLGNILKNTFQLPRPRGVWTNTHPQMDHGLPSTHTTSAFSISFYFYVFCFFIRPELSQDFFCGSTGCLAMVIVWSLSVMISRLYNGHHTPMDVTAGLLIGITVVLTMTYNLRFLVQSIINSPSIIGIGSAVLFYVCVLLFHPQPRTPTPAYPETGLVVGTGLGPIMSLWLSTNHISIPRDENMLSDTFVSEYAIVNTIRSNFTLLHFTRCLLGVLLALCVKVFSKKLYYFVYRLFNKSNNSTANVDSKDTIKENSSIIITPMVEAFGKLFVYSCVSFSIVLICPFIFYYLQLSIPLDSSNN